MEHIHQYGEIITEQASCGNNQRLIRTCRICGAIEVIGVQSNVLNHHFADQKILQNSTCMKPGKAEYTCVRCGYTKQVQLPLSGHHYVKNNPFYEECRDCSKKALTPFAKRAFMISGTSALIGGGICFALQYQQSFHTDTEVQKTTTAVMNHIGIGSVETTAFEKEMTEPAKTGSSEMIRSDLFSSEMERSLTEKSEIEITLPKTSITENDPNETPLPETTAFETEVQGITSYEVQVPETASYEPQASETTAYEQEDSTILASETKQFKPTVSEPEQSTAATKTACLESTAVETITPTSTAPVTEERQTTFADYTALTGEILNGSDLLELIEEGAPLEIITNTGIRFCANVSISGAYPLVDKDLIPTSASYTVNVIFSEHQQVIVCNQF